MVTQAIVERAAAKADVLYTPIVPFGYTPHHMGRPGEGLGTVTLRAETYRRVLEDVGRSLIYHGFNKLVFVSFHGFNVSNAEEVLFSLRFKTGAMAVFFGGREPGAWRRFSVRRRSCLASDFEAAVAMAIMGERFDRGGLFVARVSRPRAAVAGARLHQAAPARAWPCRSGGRRISSWAWTISSSSAPSRTTTPCPRRRRPRKAGRCSTRSRTTWLAFLRSVKPLAVKATSREFPDRSR